MLAMARIANLYAAGAAVDHLPGTNPGSTTRIEYVTSLADDGSVVLTPGNEVSLDDEIQSHRASTDMNLILSRYMNGDTSVLTRVQGVYADVTGAPKNMHEALAMVLRAQEDFSRLPKDIRAKFDFDCNKYISSIGSDEWFQAVRPSDSSASASVALPDVEDSKGDAK